jgi:hypothetical protein
VTLLEELTAAVDEELAAHAVSDPGPGRFERAVGEPGRRFVIEAVYEGYLLHHGEPRAFAGMDPDLRLLAGDALYALGLSRLAGDGDLEAVAELADLISLSARAAAAGRSDEVEELWKASASFLSGGGSGARAAAAGAGGGEQGA